VVRVRVGVLVLTRIIPNWAPSHVMMKMEILLTHGGYLPIR